MSSSKLLNEAINGGSSVEPDIDFPLYALSTFLGPMAGLCPVRSALLFFGNEQQIIEMRRIFSPLNVEVFSSFDFDKLVGSSEIQYDFLGVVGEIDQGKLSGLRKQLKRQNAMIFLPEESFARTKRILRNVGPIVLCSSTKDSLVPGSDVVYRFMESLMVPSLMNIDLADVRSIARGVGLSFHVDGTSSEEVIEKLPKACSWSKSALLHFSCGQSVTLKEIYEISKALAMKQNMGYYRTHPSDSRRSGTPFRRINVKIGLRLDERNLGSGIRLTGIVFGI